MARYIQDVYLNQPDDFVYFIMNDFLQKNGFTMSDWKGEAAYRAGDPMFEGYKYLKWSYNNGMFHLEAWLRGTFGGEWDLEGFVACAQKGPYKSNLQQLIATLQQPIPQAAPGQNAGAAGAQAPNTGAAADTPNANVASVTRVPVQTVDNHNAATLGLVFGILSIVFCWSAVFCIIFAVLGFSQCRMGNGSSKAGQAKAGKICCIVGLSIMGVLYVLYFGLIILSAMLSI
ncbi:MAG: hypothetical protein K2N81_12860 [Acetatifactor sp.]|nr:hypothetical protein [Acetatifactor sp.]